MLSYCSRLQASGEHEDFAVPHPEHPAEWQWLHRTPRPPNDLLRCANPVQLSSEVANSRHQRVRRQETGQSASLPTYPVNNNHRPDDDTLARYETLRQWRNNLATERGGEPDVIIGNDTLMDIARRNPKTLKSLSKTKSLGKWQGETYGQAILEVLRGIV